MWGRIDSLLQRASMLDEARREGGETWRDKLARARLALGNARTARSGHGLALEARGHIPRRRT